MKNRVSGLAKACPAKVSEKTAESFDKGAKAGDKQRKARQISPAKSGDSWQSSGGTCQQTHS
ncbi:hypothetical protein A2U01_0105107 [Trifolium medium]|uniref:Uncharacterized protein n=1 Tax=Trifolium medium TaxID=97028 RepID=A0A392VA74_9FABA|nr:hypothetical protein [Trifolium medium]